MNNIMGFIKEKKPTKVSNNSLIVAKDFTHSCAIGQTGSGKTSCYIYPNLEQRIKDKDAIDFIKNAYTPEELGLDKVKEKYSFMISSNGEKIDKKEYVKVAANVMKKNSEKNADGKETYSLTPVGEYYISFDGQDVLMKDLKSGEYKKLENRYKDYKSKSETTTKAK